jgi:hypothetical protein
MNKKYTYRWTQNEDYSKPNNNYDEETDYIITDGVHDFADWLRDSEVNFEQNGDKYYVLDECEERTGEAYLVISEEDTEEDLVC